MNKKKQQKFRDIYIKFVKKCLQEDIYPVVFLRYEQTGIMPDLTFVEVKEEEKQRILSSLDKEK